MPFQKGQSKPKNSGRKPGSTNKKKTMKVQEVLLYKDINPTEEILKLMPDLKPSEKLDAWKFLIQYLEPKIKEASESGNESDDIQTELSNESSEDLIKLIK